MKLNVNLCLVIGAIVLGVSGQVQAKVDNHNSVDVTRATVSSDSAAGKAITSMGKNMGSSLCSFTPEIA